MQYIVSLVDHSLRLIIPLFGHLNTLLREGAVYELSDFDVTISLCISQRERERERLNLVHLICLMQERNTAADFILCYEEMQPFVQTLPLVILQKEIVLSKLVSGLHMKARFSLKTLLGFAILPHLYTHEQRTYIFLCGCIKNIYFFFFAQVDCCFIQRSFGQLYSVSIC